MYRLKLFGGVSIEGAAGPLAGRIAQRRQLALLALLSLHGDRPVSRDRLLALLWPDADTERARHKLTDSVYLIRKALGEESLISRGDDLLLSSPHVQSDAAQFRQCCHAGDLEAAVALYAGPLLDGFHLPDSHEFEHWLERERNALAHDYLIALERLGARAEAAGEYRAAVEWWRRAATAAPHNGATALSYMRALAAAGDPAGALQWATTHAHLLRAEYDIEPDAALQEFAAELRASGAQPRDESSAGVDEPESTVARTRSSRPARAGSGRAPAIVVSAGLVLVAAMLLYSGMSGGAAALPDDDALDADAVVILPFRTGGASADLEYLGSGMAELLAVTLGDGTGLRPLDPVMGAEALNATREAAAGIAQRMRAGSALIGGVVGTATALTLHATLLDARTGTETARAAVHGREADLLDLLDHLIAQLLVRRAGEEEHRVTQLTSTSLPALQTFLRARAAHRNGDYEPALNDYGRALELDSTFALAAMGVRQVAGWVGGSAALDDRAALILARHSDRLSARDRVGLFGRITPRQPDTEPSVLELIDAVEEALRRWPDHPRLWYRRGDLLMHYGRALEIASWQQRARESFERAMELDPGYAEPVHHLLVVLAELGDTTAIRALATRQIARYAAGPVADHLRWWMKHLLGDEGADLPPLEALDRDATLRWIGIVAQDYGFAIEDGARAVALRLEYGGIRDQQLERRRGAFAYALNRGRPVEALAALHAIREVQHLEAQHLRLTVLSALYADGDRTAARAAARQLATFPSGAPDDELNRCVLAQWQLAHGDAIDPAAFHGADRTANPAIPIICAAVVRAQAAAAAGRHTGAEVERLEHLLAIGRHTGLVDNGGSEYAHLALARIHAAAGRTDAALRAVRRRSVYNGWQPYLAAMLREEGRLAALLHDTAGASRAYSHYLAFRTDPEPHLQPEAERVRAELDRLRRPATQ